MMIKKLFTPYFPLFILCMLMMLAVLIAGPYRVTAEGATPPVAKSCIYFPIVQAGNGDFVPPASGSPEVCPRPLTDLVDFNGDGYADLAIGIPQDNRSALVLDSGAVNVLYGTAAGLSAAGSQLWTQTLAGGFTQAGEEFGTAVSPGDFNGDGYTDLAVGSPGEDFNGAQAVGQVDILFGTPDGLLATGAQVLSPGDPGIAGAPEAQDRFGETLESGDFNADGYTDLVVGIPFEDYEAGGVVDMGAIVIFYGSDAGLRVDNDLIINPSLDTVAGTPFDNGNFGQALVAADFNNDGHDDLAVGIPGYDLNMVDNAGAVEVFLGNENGVSLVGETLWRQGFNGIEGNPENNDRFGQALTAGDFDKNGAADLAVGVPNEDVETGGGTIANAGAFHVIYGFALTDGLSGSGDQLWHQGLPDVLGDAEPSDAFGYALVAADFNGDGADDLAVSAPFEANDVALQGQVIAFYSNGSILAFDNQDLFMQGIVQGVPEAGDAFGTSLGTSDFDGNGIADLAVGSPFEDVLFGGVDHVDAGAVNVMYGQDTGLGITNNQIWGQHVDGIEGSPENGENYGFALSR